DGHSAVGLLFPTRRSSDLIGAGVLISAGEVGEVEVSDDAVSSDAESSVPLAFFAISSCCSLAQRSRNSRAERVSGCRLGAMTFRDRKSTRLNSSHVKTSYA